MEPSEPIKIGSLTLNGVFMDIKNILKKDKEPKRLDSMYIKVTSGQAGGFDFFYEITNNEEAPARLISLEEIEDKKAKVYRASSFDVPVTVAKNNMPKNMKVKDFFKKEVAGVPLKLGGVFPKEHYIVNKKHAVLEEFQDSEQDIRVAPLVMLADRFLKDQTKGVKKSSHERVIKIITILIRSPDNSMAIMWMRNKSGFYERKSFAILNATGIENEADFNEQVIATMSNKLSQNSSSSGEGTKIDLSDSDVEIIGIPEIELLKYAKAGYKSDTYPVDAEIFHLPKNYVALTGTIVGGGIAFAGLSFNTYTEIELSKIKKEESRIQSQMPNVNEIRKELMQSHVNYYLSDKNIDFSGGFRASEQVWMPNTSVELTQDASTTRIRLLMKMSNANGMSGGNDADSRDLYQIARDMEEQEAPEGFVKEPVTSSGRFSEYEVSYVKQGN